MFSRPFYIYFNSYKRLNTNEPHGTSSFNFRTNRAYTHMSLINYSIPKVLVIDNNNNNFAYSEDDASIGNFLIP